MKRVRLRILRSRHRMMTLATNSLAVRSILPELLDFMSRCISNMISLIKPSNPTNVSSPITNPTAPTMNSKIKCAPIAKTLTIAQKLMN